MQFTKWHHWRVAAGAAGVWVWTMVAGHAQWAPDSSEKMAADSPLVTFTRKTVSGGSRRVELRAVFFNVKQCALKVVDDAPGTASLESAMRAHGCIAGVNGNYFHPDRTSLGLVISDGHEIHALEHAKLLSGLLVVKEGGFALVRVEEFKPGAGIKQALQAGPFLVDKGAAVAGLEATRRAERTVVATDGNGNGALIICDEVTLSEMAALLSTRAIFPELKIERALNLDGGSSTGLWVDAKPSPFYQREISEVRNYLGIIPR
ncbi:MAG TPA: phosphodiester glycosidase family protein [Chthoniobacteraceae bacterium]|nr:phosphodiester glycosidase family protein [Chthoniobacteraceae bacterium]